MSDALNRVSQEALDHRVSELRNLVLCNISLHLIDVLASRIAYFRLYCRLVVPLFGSVLVASKEVSCLYHSGWCATAASAAAAAAACCMLLILLLSILLLKRQLWRGVRCAQKPRGSGGGENLPRGSKSGSSSFFGVRGGSKSCQGNSSS